MKSREESVRMFDRLIRSHAEDHPPQHLRSSMMYGRMVALTNQEDEIACPTEYVLDFKVCTIGRADGCDILLNHDMVSRLHATIEYDRGRYLLQDAQSKNGTFVNGRKVTDVYQLKDHDLIGFGTVSPSFRFIDPDPTYTHPNMLFFDSRQGIFYIGQQLIPLSREQTQLLLYLYNHAGGCCPRYQCIEAIWGSRADTESYDKALSDLVYKLRAKLREIMPSVEYIGTRAGFGYLLKLSADE